jgi:hypothetical protein
MENRIIKLIFVYNAKSGFMHGAMDLIHKTVKPSTYPCRLCQVTYKGAQMNKVWKKYIDGLGIPSIFLHKDEYIRLYPNSEIRLPCIFAETNDGLIVLVGQQEFFKITNLDNLIKKLDQRLKKYGLLIINNET